MDLILAFRECEKIGVKEDDSVLILVGITLLEFFWNTVGDRTMLEPPPSLPLSCCPWYRYYCLCVDCIYVVCTTHMLTLP